MRLFKYTASMTCKLIFGMGQTLVLNASYEPLNITSWRRAVILMIKGKAESLEEINHMPYILGKTFLLLLGFATTLKFPSERLHLQGKIYFLETITHVNTVTIEEVIYR